ncbi:MAG: CRISPR-associated endonuclease Cas2 [Gammaproteobacteria bacterium HGW-Gammaproteobacteria-7]|nr:MAG: CRISPR-associated endonuclease Cas2 [Gammaproteobacteria bacterium HGW-Gammaproteobacteria-7]
MISTTSLPFGAQPPDEGTLCPTRSVGKAVRTLYLLGYDIRDDARRARLLKQVKARAVGGQKSLYECWLNDAELESLRHTISSIIDPNTDRAAVIRLDPRASIVTLGAATPPPNANFLYFG